jgi:hypothetical protein
MLNIDLIEAYYQYFYRHRYKDFKYKFKRTKTTTSVCHSFLKIIDEEYSLHSVGQDFLWDYFLFQFQYWDDLYLKNGFSEKILIAWIIGKKAFQRWQFRDKEYDWQIDNSLIIEKYNLNKNDLFGFSEQIEKSNKSLFDSSKFIRKQYLNTDKGFAMCVEFTTLFDPKDMNCIRCNSRSECKELLKINYPNLFKQRIDNKNEISIY